MSTKRYATDLTDEQWAIVEPLIPPKIGRGRTRRIPSRRILDALFYISRTGCQYRLLPHDFPAWETVYYHFSKWQKDGTLARIHDALRQQVRQAERPDERTTASIDSQSTDSAGAREEVAFDGGKKLDGRKRHIVVDSLGMLLAVVITAGNVPEARAAPECLRQMPPAAYPCVTRLFADSAYLREGFDKDVKRWKADCVLTVISRTEGKRGWEKLPKRWVVERTFAWLTRNRRLCRSYEHTTESEKGYIQLAMMRLMLRRRSGDAAKAQFNYRKSA